MDTDTETTTDARANATGAERDSRNSELDESPLITSRIGKRCLGLSLAAMGYALFDAGLGMLLGND